MTHTYTISGMTCNGCRTGVEEKLRALIGVTKVDVNLEKEIAVIEMESQIPLSIFQNALPEKYSISASDIAMADHAAGPKSEKNSEMAQLFPLFLILGYISIAAFLLNRIPFALEGFMLDFMGLFYIVFSFFKLLDLKGFSNSFRMYDPLARKMPIYGWVYPFLEVVMGLMYLLRFRIDLAVLATIILLGITTVGVSKVLLDKRSIQCACLGTALKLPMTKATFIENAIMIAMSLLMLKGIS